MIILARQLWMKYIKKLTHMKLWKNVTYHLNFNEKDEPQLFIEVCEGEESSKEVYRPETYFSTAQLNTVAFSSFLEERYQLIIYL